MEQQNIEKIAVPSVDVPQCGLYIVLPETDDFEKLNFQLGQALHGANRFSTYAVNRHVVELRHLPKDKESALVIAKNLCHTAHRNGFIFLICDDAALARDVEADGVMCTSLKHCSEARKALGEDSIVGLRCATRAAAQSALSLELDCVNFYTDKHGEPLLTLVNWWTTASEDPVGVEGPFDPENCESFVKAGVTFITADHHIWTHPSGNMMQGVVNMLDAFERYKPTVQKAH